MKKRILFFIVVIGLAIFALYFYQVLPIVIEKHVPEIISVDPNSVEFNPLEKLDFKSNDISFYLSVAKSDVRYLPNGMSKYRIFKCQDQELIQRIKDVFFFRKSGGDMSTCESSILVYKDETLVLHIPFVLTDSIVGLQSRPSGWSEAVYSEKLKKLFLTFNPVPTVYKRFQ